MSKTYVVVSSYVDSTIRESQLDTTFYLFQTLEELGQYIEQSPIRADSLFFTRETIPYTNTSLNFLISLLGNSFFKVDSVVYITEKDSPELPSLRFIIKEKDLTNWHVIIGYLNREYVAGIVTGALRESTGTQRRKAVYRIPRTEYIRAQMEKRIESLNEPYKHEEFDIKDTEDLMPPIRIISEVPEVCQLVHVAGANCLERTVFAVVLAQYAAMRAKTMIVEKDCEYHTLTDAVSKSSIEYFTVDVADVIKDPLSVFEAIRHCTQNLIIISSFSRIEYSYNFICSLLYSNLSDYLSFFIREDTYDEAPPTAHQIVVFPSTVPAILKMCENVDCSYLNRMTFVGVCFANAMEYQIFSSKVCTEIIQDVLEDTSLSATVVRITSMKVGGDIGYDLCSLIKN